MPLFLFFQLIKLVEPEEPKDTNGKPNGIVPQEQQQPIEEDDDDDEWKVCIYMYLIFSVKYN